MVIRYLSTTQWLIVALERPQRSYDPRSLLFWGTIAKNTRGGLALLWLFELSTKPAITGVLRKDMIDDLTTWLCLSANLLTKEQDVLLSIYISFF